MKKIHLKKFIFCSILMLFLIIISSCSAKSSSEPSSTPTLRFLLRGTATGLDRVLNELYSQMDDEHRWKLEFTLIESDEYVNELSRIIAAHENYDFVFDAPWLNMNVMIQNGSYRNLDTYFQNEQYPGLYSAFTEDYLSSNLFNDHIYAIPITNSYYDPTGIFYRKDLLIACNLGFEEISSKEQLLQFYECIRQKYPDIAPISVGSRGFFLVNSYDLSFRSSNIFDVNGWSYFEYPAKIVLNEDSSIVLDVVFPGDDSSHFSTFAEPYNYDFLSETFLQNAAYHKYVQSNSLFAIEGSTLFLTGGSASFEAAIGTGGSAEQQRKLRQYIPDGEVAFWCYEPSLSPESREQNQITTNLQAWNFLCIPTYTVKEVESMRFLDWLYSDQSRLELFIYGVEGTDWEAVGDNEYLLLDNPSGIFSFPAYELTWSPLYHRLEKNLPEYEKALLQYSYDSSNYKKSPLTGWSINTSHIAIEIARLNALYSKYDTALSHGAYEEHTKEKIQELHEASEALGLETVRKSLITQIQAYLDKNTGKSD